MNNFRAAVRSLRSTPGPTALIVVTLAVAIGANAAIFSVINGLLLKPLGYGDDSRLLVVWAATDTDPDGIFRLSPADYRDLRDGADAFAGQVSLYRYLGSTLTGLEQPVRVGSMTVTPRLFGMLEATATLGRLFGVEDERPGGPQKVLLTHASWTRRFGSDPDIVGSVLEIDGTPRTVVGVIEPDFRFPPGSRDVEIYFPMTLTGAILEDRDHRMFDAVARLDEGVTVAAARQELAAIADRLATEFPRTNTGWTLTARPLREELFGDLVATLWVLGGAVFLVLLIACANIANVLVARSAAASREFAVRAALGAKRLALCRRSITESLILSAAGGAGGLLLAGWGGRLLGAAMPADIAQGRAIVLDTRVLLFASSLALASAVLFGSLPALRGMAPNLLGLLSTTGSLDTAGGRRLRELMVVVEVALAIVLLVSAGLMLRSFAKLRESDPGFRPDGVAAVGVQLSRRSYNLEEWRPFFEELTERVASLPGVESAGAVSDLPMSSVGLDLQLEFSVEGVDALDPSVRPNADWRLVLPGYFETMGVEIVRGRGIERGDTAGDRAVVVVNETAAGRYFKDVDPIGRTLRIPQGAFEIVGVAADIRHGGLQAKYESEVFLPYGQILTGEMQLVVRTDADLAAVADMVGGQLTDMDPDVVPSRIVALSDLTWESAAELRFNAALLSTLALCGAVLATLGTYAIVAYSVSERAGEIGVRMALGADAAGTIGMIVRDALRVVLLGAALGTICAVGASRLLGRFLFEVEPTDPLTYFAVLTATLAVGGIAAWPPARRATRIQPVAALRR